MPAGRPPAKTPSKCPAKPPPRLPLPKPCPLAQKKQQAINDKLDNLLNKFGPAKLKNPTQGASSTLAPNQVSTGKDLPRKPAPGGPAPSGKPSSGPVPPRTIRLPTASMPKVSSGLHPTRASTHCLTRNGTAAVDDDNVDERTIENYQAEIDNLCGFGQEDNGDDDESVFHKPPGKPRRKPSATRTGYNIQLALGLGVKTDSENGENTAVYNSLLLNRKHPEIINTQHYPHPWAVNALINYCFKNLCGYITWEKPVLAKKKVEAAQEQPVLQILVFSLTVATDTFIISRNDFLVPTNTVYSEVCNNLRMPPLSWWSRMPSQESQRRSLLSPSVRKVSHPSDDAPVDDGYLSYPEAEEDEMKPSSKLEREEEHNEEDDEDNGFSDVNEDTLLKLLKLQKLMKQNPKIACALSHAPSMVPKKVLKCKSSLGGEDAEEEEEEVRVVKKCTDSGLVTRHAG
ncbi:hypothetical protein NMY22_g9853 [Coprinellus aureogranulatus]|nr:hypothetical protein NMY22_g9853 [Coprinellus aureogranulatus]